MSTQHPLFPIIVGCGRSGTTLLRAMLDAGPELHIPPESRFIPTLLDHCARLQQPGGVDVDRALSLLEDNEHYRHWGLPPRDDVRAWLINESPTTVPDLVRSLYRLHADRVGKPRYGDKSPPYVMQIPRLAATFPEAKFVHLVRDGRDVAKAYVDAPFGPTTVAEASLHWRLRVSRGRRAGQRLGSDRYLEIRYEDLVSSPEPTIRRVCHFIDLDFDQSMLRPEDHHSEVVAADRNPMNHERLRQPVTVGVRDWRRDLDPRPAAAAALLAGRELRRHGYPVGWKIPVRSVVDAGRAVLAWYAARVRKRIVGG